MIPNPICRVLSSMRAHRVHVLLMGGHACVFYGAAEFSRDPKGRRQAEHRSGPHVGAGGEHLLRKGYGVRQTRVTSQGVLDKPRR